MTASAQQFNTVRDRTWTESDGWAVKGVHRDFSGKTKGYVSGIEGPADFCRKTPAVFGGLPSAVRDNIEKCRSAAIAAVDVYNRPGPRFRIVLTIIAWTALFHAMFYKGMSNHGTKRRG